jgi:hypothetical protein
VLALRHGDFHQEPVHKTAVEDWVRVDQQAHRHVAQEESRRTEEQTDAR